MSAVLQTGGLLRDLNVGETVRAVAALHHADARAGDVVRRAGLDRLASLPEDGRDDARTRLRAMPGA